MAFALGPKALSSGYRLAAYEAIGSTSSEAMQRGRARDPGRLWVVAREQTAGHGRRGRAWQTPSGNLAASLLLALPKRTSQAATLGFAAGLALEAAIRACAKPSPPCGERVAGPELLAKDRLGEGSLDASGVETTPPPARLRRATPSPQGGGELGLRLKWPNDVLIDGAKVAGILLEASTLRDDCTIVVIGIGVNVRHRPEGAPYPVTALLDHGVDLPPDVLFTALAESWVEQDQLWSGGHGFRSIRDRWLDRAAGLGAPITVRQGETMLRGTFEAIDEDGRLVVRAADGLAHMISAGEVHFGDAATVSL